MSGPCQGRRGAWTQLFTSAALRDISMLRRRRIALPLRASHVPTAPAALDALRLAPHLRRAHVQHC